MEINYFLDSQQIMFENLIADVGLEGEIFKSCENSKNLNIEENKEIENETIKTSLPHNDFDEDQNE